MIRNADHTNGFTGRPSRLSEKWFSGDKLVAALGAVVSNVDELDDVVPLLSNWAVITVAARW